jgi:hypothetical protein
MNCHGRIPAVLCWILSRALPVERREDVLGDLDASLAAWIR